jgi:gas vesicle protein
MENIQKRIKTMYGYNGQKDFFWGALLGGTIATLVSLLFTTKKGKQIQKQVGDLYEDIEDTVKQKVSDTTEKVEDAADHVGKKIASKTKHHDEHHK